MKNSFGSQIQCSLFGESHGQAIGIVIDGLAPGIALDMDFIQKQMGKRKAQGRISTARQEADDVQIVSGYFNGYTTGTPLCVLLVNHDTKSKDYGKLKDLMRPGHADYTAQLKYLGFQDYRGGGHFSGRLTAPIVAAGAICLQILQSKGIAIGSHILQLKEIVDLPFAEERTILAEQIKTVNEKYFPVLEDVQGQKMIACIESAQAAGDSVGGMIESAVLGLPGGIGEPFFDSVESILSHLLFSVPAVKGVEFGLGFGFANLFGSQANDSFYFDPEGKVQTATNHNGGLNGGITNGMSLKVRTCIKPTPSIYQKQQTVNLHTQANEELQIQGRHDPAIIHRARVVIDSMLAIGLLDLLTVRFGTLWMREEK